MKDKVDGKFLSTMIAGGFVGSMFAFYGSSSGMPTDNTARFNWFSYKGADEVYR